MSKDFNHSKIEQLLKELEIPMTVDEFMKNAINSKLFIQIQDALVDYLGNPMGQSKHAAFTVLSEFNAERFKYLSSLN